MKRCTTTGKKFSKEDMVLDEDHPPGEALASNLNDIKQFFTPDAWSMSNNSSKCSLSVGPCFCLT